MKKRILKETNHMKNEVWYFVQYLYLATDMWRTFQATKDSSKAHQIYGDLRPTEEEIIIKNY